MPLALMLSREGFSVPSAEAEHCAMLFRALDHANSLGRRKSRAEPDAKKLLCSTLLSTKNLARHHKIDDPAS